MWKNKPGKANTLAIINNYPLWGTIEGLQGFIPLIPAACRAG
jgi:hypothetical protein